MSTDDAAPDAAKEEALKILQMDRAEAFREYQDELREMRKTTDSDRVAAVIDTVLDEIAQEGGA